MPIPDWHEAIDLVVPQVFRIVTPDGSGTGWLLTRSNKTTVCAVVTAAHVIDHAHYWEEPIRLLHHSSGETVLLRPADRAVTVHEKTDTAAIVFDGKPLKLPATQLPLMKKDHHLKPGVQVGWIGFPGIVSPNRCFFSGHISAYLDSEESYLVDGVAINGVSGGPAFRCHVDNAEMMGIVSAYIPNRATGEVLPGVALLRDVNRLHEITARFKTLDEAQAEQTPAKEGPPPPAKETDPKGAGVGG